MRTPLTSAVLRLAPISLPASPKRVPAIMGEKSRVFPTLVASVLLPVVFGDLSA